MKFLVLLVLGLVWGCSDKVENRCGDVTRASNDCTVLPEPDANNGLTDADTGDMDPSTDATVDSDAELDVSDDASSDASTDQDAQSDLTSDAESDLTTDAESDSPTDVDMDESDADADTGPLVYDETGWAMKQNTITESASSGTPDSYFYDVDPGSPLSATITGGGSGVWSVNVFGGYSNMLYCTGTPSCQVMLRPEDTTVIVTAITTGIGSYSLTIRFAGDGRQ